MPTPADPRYRSDCSHCQALCCVALRFSAQSGFPADKPAGVPCEHLEAGTARCGVWAGREGHGYVACQSYDCYGAGQAVSAVMEARGERWATLPPERAATCFDDFRRLTRINALLARLAPGTVDDATLRDGLEAVADDYARTGVLAPCERVQRLLAAHEDTVIRILKKTAALQDA